MLHTVLLIFETRPDSTTVHHNHGVMSAFDIWACCYAPCSMDASTKEHVNLHTHLTKHAGSTCLPELLQLKIASSSVGVAQCHAHVYLDCFGISIDGCSVVACSVHAIGLVLQKHGLPL